MARSRKDAYPDDFDDEDFDEGGPGGNDRLKRLALDLVGRWYWIALGLVFGLLAAGYYLSKAPKVYTAQSTLLIKTQTSAVMGGEELTDVNLASLEALNTAASQIARPELLRKVAARELPGLVPPEVDWTPSWFGSEDASTAAPVPAPEVLAGAISDWLEISVRRGTRLLDLRVTHPVKEVSRGLADAIALEYLEEIRSDLDTGRGETIELLTKESEATSSKLQEARSALSGYARALEAHQKLDEQEVLVAQLDQRYLPAHPKMKAANDEFERLKARFISEFEVARQSPSDIEYWEQINSELPDPETMRDRFIRVARQQLLARTGVLESEIESQSAVFDSMLTRLEEASVNRETEQSSAELFSAALKPGLPSGPIPKKIYAAGGLGGLAFGLAFAFLAVRLDNKYRTVAEIERDTDSTVLAAVSDIAPSHLDQATARHFKKHPEDESDAYDEWDPHLVFRPGTTDTSYAEMYRILRASVSLLGDEAKRKITCFTSALPGEGKTFTSVNFALAAAAQGHRTLLIDCDLRKPAVHKAFGMTRETEVGGITEALAGIADFRKTVLTGFPDPNFHVILSGRRAPNPGELLDTGRLKEILEWAAGEYDQVVLDTSPLLAVPDTRIIARLVDNMCLVVRAQYVPKGAVRRTLEVLDEDGTRLDGIVFNGFKEKKRLIGQNYSYGHYKTSRYGRAYRYGYGYGAYGSDDEDDAPDPKRKKVGSRKR